MSGFSGEGLPSGRCGERTPLRNVQNKMQHLSTPSSRFKSKSPLDADAVKPTKGDLPVCEPQLQSPPSSKVIQINASPIAITPTEAADGLGDVTFKSFICPGGEIEYADSSVCAEESIILPKDQDMKNTHETEDTLISDSIIVQSCDDHTDHPYCNPEMKDDSQVNIQAVHLCEISNTTLASGDFHTSQNDGCGMKDVTWKSFACDGGEVELSDVTRLQDETIPLPTAQLVEALQDDSVNVTNVSDCGQLLGEDHADHPYFSSRYAVCDITTSTETPNGSEEAADEQSDVTFKSFNCSGGVIEISDATKLTDETVPLLTDQAAACSETHDYGIDPSVLAGEDVQNGNDHLDHPYCNIENGPLGEPLPFSLDVVDEVKQMSMVVPDSQTARQEGVTFSSFSGAKSDCEISDRSGFSHKTSPLTDKQALICQPCDKNSEPNSATQEPVQEEQLNRHVENDDVVVDADPTVSASSLASKSLMALDDNAVDSQRQKTPTKELIHPQDIAVPSVLQQMESADCSHHAALAETSSPVKVSMEQVQLSSGPHESSEAKDSALGSSGNAPAVCNSTEKLQVETLPDVLRVLSECPSVASAFQLGILSPVVRRASLAALKAFRAPVLDDSAIENEKSVLAPFNFNPAGLCLPHLESPMPRPLLNSTALCCKPQPEPTTEPAGSTKPGPVAQSEAEKPVLDIPLIPDGPLQQQLRQMAEFLFAASGKMAPAAVSAPVLPPTAVTVPLGAAKAAPPPAESHSVCVGTTPIKWMDHSVNTSGHFERKRHFSVVDSCTLTDPLLWNTPPGTLECLPKPELEQRLISSMIMVEALVQQLASSRANGRLSSGPAPSDLREKLVQTDHTELSQNSMYRDLYLEALSRIAELELDGSSLQNLIQCMQDMKVTMTSLSCDTDAALSNMKQMGDVVRGDHQSLVSHYGQMKSLLEKTKETQTRMMQKLKDALHQRDDMRLQMEEAVRDKEAAFSVTSQVRTHCATEISELQKIVGPQQELLAALQQTYPEQLALDQARTEMLNSATDVLSTTMEEQSSLMKELCTVRALLQKAAPMLVKLNEKAAAALRERDEHLSARDQAVEEREQIEEELNQANTNLQSATEQISDLKLQVTILNSEMGVLRHKLTEREEERGLLERKVTELSATVSSTLASYTFLEQALAAESTKLQQSWKDIQQARERADELETSLGQSQQRESELSHSLAQSEEQLSQLQILSQSQNTQIQQLQEVCAQLSGVKEMNEFLQVENDFAREQMAESERLLRANLQGLRERNIQCEDLKGELAQLQLEKRSLQEELETTRSRSAATQQELEQNLAQAFTEVTLLHHTLRGLTNELHAALNDQKPESQKEKDSQLCRHPSASFVDSVMFALTTEKEEDVTPGSAPSDTSEPQCETLSSETSAFTRIATPKKNLHAAELEPEEDEQSSVSEVFADLGNTVTELMSNLKLLQQRKDAQLEEQRTTISGLQVEQQATNNRHEADVFELKRQLGHLNSLLEKGNQALQQKAQDEKTVTKLMLDLQETQEILNKHKTDSNDMRKEVVELRRSLQQSKVESQFLREELRKAGSQSANPSHFMEEKIQLLREVERLKLSLQEETQAKVKLLERAKRHQIIQSTNQQKSENELQMLNKVLNRVRETLLSLPDVVKKCEQLQHLVEYIG